MLKIYSLVALGCLSAGVAHADTIAVENFDSLGTYPSEFSLAGPAQTITDTGVATFTGGVILGGETNLPGIVYATPPNVYGTAATSASLGLTADPSLLQTLTITMNPSFATGEVSFLVLNGETETSSFVADAYDGTTLVATQAINSVASNEAEGYALVDLLAPTITSVTIEQTTLEDGVWDYSIDSVAFNESIENEFNPTGPTNPTPTPEPSSLLMLGSGLITVAGGLYRRARRAV